MYSMHVFDLESEQLLAISMEGHTDDSLSDVRELNLIHMYIYKW